MYFNQSVIFLTKQFPNSNYKIKILIKNSSESQLSLCHCEDWRTQSPVLCSQNRLSWSLYHLTWQPEAFISVLWSILQTMTPELHNWSIEKMDTSRKACKTHQPELFSVCLSCFYIFLKTVVSVLLLSFWKYCIKTQFVVQKYAGLFVRVNKETGVFLGNNSGLVLFGSAVVTRAGRRK